MADRKQPSIFKTLFPKCPITNPDGILEPNIIRYYSHEEYEIPEQPLSADRWETQVLVAHEYGCPICTTVFEISVTVDS